MDKASALQKLKQQQMKAKERGHSAASSHLRNDEYMQEFETGWQALHGLSIQAGGREQDHTSTIPSCTRGSHASSRGSTPTTAPRSNPSSRYASPASAHAQLPSRACLSQAWRTGPSNPEGQLLQLSDRPSICSCADWTRGEVVVGSSDHALYVVDVRSRRKTRTLYSKTAGHKEWVTCVAMCPDGKVVSGGMDSALWLWPRGSTRGSCLSGHSAAVSQVSASPCSTMAASCSYDKTVRLWHLTGRPAEASCLTGHPAPVLQMASHPSDHRILTGDRNGHVILWDTQAEAASWHLKNIHSGHVTALTWHQGDASGAGGGQLFVTGGQDGCVRVWDPRAREHVAKVELHVNAQGKGAVGNIAAGGPEAAGKVVTAGADGTVRVLDPAAGYQQEAAVKLTDFPYQMVAHGRLALVGCGDGSLHVVDILEGRTLYGLGANHAAVRTIDAGDSSLVCSGDDGHVIVYEY